MQELLDQSGDLCLQEHLPLCGLRLYLTSEDSRYSVSVKLDYANAHSVSGSPIANFASCSSFGALEYPFSLLSTCKPHSKNRRLRASCDVACSPGSETTSYNDVLSSGIWLESPRDAKRTSHSMYAAGSPTAHSGAKQEPGSPNDAASGDNESEQSPPGQGEGGSAKDADSKQSPDGDSEDNGASGDKSDGGSGDDGSDDEDEEEDDGVVRCVCGEHNDGELMIQCEICQVWQHTLCMGIRDEAHIPDKYYCEKCHPQDHPFINSRPRTIVLAEASAVGASTMMRRSAVMAVAKMTAREEYRSAAAAAAIAASVAAAATHPAGGKPAGGNSRRSSAKKPAAGSAKRAEGAAGAQKSSRRAPRRSRKSQSGADGTRVDGSEDDYDENKPADTPDTGGSSNGGPSRVGGDGSADRPKNGRRSSNAAALTSPLSSRKAQTPKRPAAGQSNGSGKRRKTGGTRTPGDSPNMEPTSGEGQLPGEGDAFAEDLVARMMSSGKPSASKAQRNRSISTLAGTGALQAGSQKRRGKSEPGSPTQQSPSPPVFGADCGELGTIADDPEDNEASGSGEQQQQQKSAKRKRTGASSRSNNKHLRMTVSAANSPSLGDGASAFGLFAEGSGGGRSAMAANDDGACSAEGDDSQGAQRPPKHSFPPLETEDGEGNRITVPSSMLNSQGQPIYSSVASDTMCKIRYPHGRASLYELNRRAKQLLEWIGKAQSEYELERTSWLPPLSQDGPDGAIGSMLSALQELVPLPPNGEPTGRRLAELARDGSHQLSDAPTSPINPSDWPADENYDGEESITDTANAAPAEPGDQSRPRSTLSMMEDLMWRLIRFQETYSN
ncbi:Histone deacetylase complex subunit [Coemansia sp. S610]|nr:Histone deacetylase complex subunit [Coemansia sp. S610]